MRLLSSWSRRRWLEPAAVRASALGSAATSGIGRQLPIREKAAP
jgi:hypothetical protein